MLPAFLARYPEIRMSLFIETRPVETFPKNADVVIRIGPLRDSGLIARKIAAIRLLICASPSYLSARGIPKTLDDLSGHCVVGNADPRYTWRFRTSAGANQEFEFTPTTVVSEPAATKALLIGGVGIGRLPDYLAADALATGTLVHVLPDCEGETVDAHALYPSHRSLSAKVRVFVDALVAHLKKVSETLRQPRSS